VKLFLPDYLKLLTAIFFLFCLNACEFKPASQHTSAEQIVTESTSEGASPEIENASVISAKELKLHRPLVKPGAAVGLRDKQPLTAEAPGTYEYQLQLISPKHKGKMTVDVSTSDGITIISPERHFEFALQERGEYSVPLTINASAEGRFYIQLHVSIAVEGQSASRVIAAILQVGEPAVKVQKAAAKTTAKDSDAVISLPAQETISPR